MENVIFCAVNFVLAKRFLIAYAKNRINTINLLVKNKELFELKKPFHRPFFKKSCMGID